MIREAAPTTVEKTTTVTAPAPKAQSSKESASASPESEAASTSSRETPPHVVGLILPSAERSLRAAGFKTEAENTDTTFGIIVRRNYTVCKQYPPKGKTVRVLAQKYGCWQGRTNASEPRSPG